MPTKKTVKKAPAKKVAKKVVKKTVKKSPAKKAVKKAPVRKVVKKAPAKKAVKKVVKKTVKKSPVKKASNSKKRELTLSNEQTAFWVTNGQILDSLLTLRDALDEMDEEVFKYHVSKERNDFANWVGVVLCDEDCAKELEKVKSPKSAKTVVVRHLKFYSV